MRTAAVVACLALSIILSPMARASAQPRKIGSVYDVKDVGTVTRQGAPARPLAVTDDVFVGDTITTGGESHVVIGFGAGALADLRERSTMTITGGARNPVLNLENGVVYYRVPRDENRRDEAEAVFAPNAIARTTGDVWVKVDRASDAVIITTVCVLAGNGSAATPGGGEAKIPERNCVTVNGSILGTVSPLPPPRPIPHLDLPFVACG